MEIFKNKFLVKLIATICLFLTLLNFAGSSKVYAAKAKDDEVWGGVLLNPIIDLMASIGDTIMEILHTSVQSQDLAIIKIDGNQDWVEGLGIFLSVVAAIFVAAVFIAVVVATSGGIAVAAAHLAGTLTATTFSTAAVNVAGGALAGGAVVGIIAGFAAREAMIPNDIYLPAFSITAEQIFRNELALFDVNFFNPGTYYTEEVVLREDQSTNVDSNETSSTLLLPWTGNGNEYSDVRSKAEQFKGQTFSIEEAKSKGFQKIIDAVNTSDDLPSDQKITTDMKFKIYEKNRESENEVRAESLGYKEVRCKNTTIYMFSIINEKLENSEYLYIKHTYIEEYTNTTNGLRS